MKTENLHAVIANIHGINIITRNKMKKAATQGDLEAIEALITEDTQREYAHIRPEVQVAITAMIAQIREHAALAANFKARLNFK